jgi:hypothetical protein
VARPFIPRDRLQAVADLAPKPEPKPEANSNGRHHHSGNGSSHRLMVADYLRDAGADFRHETGKDGSDKYIINPCPFNPDHKGKDAAIFQDRAGKLTFHCFHDGCRGKTWHDIKDVFGEPKPHHFDPPKTDWRKQHEDHRASNRQAETKPVDEPIRPVSFRDFAKSHPKLREALIDGLVRLGETCNIIADPKMGKSWMAYALALCIIIGGRWLGKYPCRKGRVLIIDNELLPANIANRIPTVARAMGLEDDDYQDHYEVISLRGRLMDLPSIGHRIVKHLRPGQFDAVIVDAWYRVLSGSENDNETMRNAYNLVDQFAMQTGAAWFLIHHASKGSQSEKRVTDVGAGAGAQSRAADTHLVLREHEQDGVVVLDAAVRSFPPVEPLAIQWTFPVWERVDDIDTTQLKGRKSPADERQTHRDGEGKGDILEALKTGPATRRQLRTSLGMGPDRLNRLISQLIKSKEVEIIKLGEHENIQLAKWSAGLKL